MDDKLLNALKIAADYINALEGELSYDGISTISPDTEHERKKWDQLLTNSEILEALNFKTGN